MLEIHRASSLSMGRLFQLPEQAAMQLKWKNSGTPNWYVTTIHANLGHLSRSCIYRSVKCLFPLKEFHLTSRCFFALLLRFLLALCQSGLSRGLHLALFVGMGRSYMSGGDCCVRSSW